MIYFMPICEAAQLEEQYQNWLPHLPPSRQEKLLRYRFAKDRWLCAAAYMLLLHGLQEEYGLAEDQIVMEIADSGKPYLSSHPHIYFNLSHCDAGVACGISNAPIGIDVESVRKIDNCVMKRVLLVNEQEVLSKSFNPMYAFSVIWTLKESWVKAIGYGLEFSLDKVVVDIAANGSMYIHQNGYEAWPLEQQSSCCISVCSEAGSQIERMVCEIDSHMI